MDAQLLLLFQGNFSSSKGCQANMDVLFPYRKQENEIVNAYYPKNDIFAFDNVKLYKMNVIQGF